MEYLKTPDYLAETAAEAAAARAERNTLPADVQARVDELSPKLTDAQRATRDRLIAEWRRVHRADDRRMALGAIRGWLTSREHGLARKRDVVPDQPQPATDTAGRAASPATPDGEVAGGDQQVKAPEVAADVPIGDDIPVEARAAIEETLRARNKPVTPAAISAMWRRISGGQYGR